MILVWIVPALLVAAVLVYLASLRTRELLPDVELHNGERLPRTALQEHATWTLVAVTALTGSATGLVIYHSPQVWWNDDPVRLSVTAILIIALLAYFAFTIVIRNLEKREDGSLDERDITILNRSHAGVGGAMMVVIAVWMVALTETHQETHLVPTYYLYLMFWSCVMTNVIASVAGILLAYRRT